MRVHIAVVTAVATLGVTAGAATAFSSTTPTLKGVVGPGFTISLRDGKGHLVKTLKAGTYRFALTDKADIHTFSLKQTSGGTFNKDLTSDAFQGTKTVKVKLAKGKWQYYCAVHPTEMFGNFTVK